MPRRRASFDGLLFLLRGRHLRSASALPLLLFILLALVAAHPALAAGAKVERLERARDLAGARAVGLGLGGLTRGEGEAVAADEQREVGAPDQRRVFGDEGQPDGQQR